MYWVFYITNEYGDQSEERDYSGDNYRILISRCVKYCDEFSFKTFHNNVKNFDAFEPFRVTQPKQREKTYFGYAFSNRLSIGPKFKEVHYYRVCEETHKLLLDTADDMFKWIEGWGYFNPEDLAFYRSDGSVFLESQIHEGCFVLYPRENEDVSDILADPKWYCYSDDGQLLKLGE